ncbi:hypothetical protein RB595_004136 [Gaeumannomyces hyphopodioides]
MMQPDKERSLKVLLFLVLFAVDVALNAAAGPAAVATGAHVNDPSAPPPSGRALGIGATSGAIKAGVMAFIGLLQAVDLALRLTNLGVRPVPQYIIGIAINMVIYFGLSVLISAYVCLEVLGEAPSELLKAAVVAALPIQLEKMMQGEISLRKTTTTAGGQYTKTSANYWVERPRRLHFCQDGRKPGAARVFKRRRRCRRRCVWRCVGDFHADIGQSPELVPR